MEYRVLSPDGIDIAPTTYASEEEAREALGVWVKRYEQQAYYRDNRWNKIPVAEIAKHCEITTA